VFPVPTSIFPVPERVAPFCKFTISQVPVRTTVVHERVMFLLSKSIFVA
jgi:hypothetical protein